MLRRPLFEQACLPGALGSHAVDALAFVLEGEPDEVLGFGANAWTWSTSALFRERA